MRLSMQGSRGGVISHQYESLARNWWLITPPRGPWILSRRVSILVLPNYRRDYIYVISRVVKKRKKNTHSYECRLLADSEYSIYTGYLESLVFSPGPTIFYDMCLSDSFAFAVSQRHNWHTAVITIATPSAFYLFPMSLLSSHNILANTFLVAKPSETRICTKLDSLHHR